MAEMENPEDILTSEEKLKRACLSMRLRRGNLLMWIKRLGNHPERKI